MSILSDFSNQLGTRIRQLLNGKLDRAGVADGGAQLVGTDLTLAAGKQLSGADAEGTPRALAKVGDLDGVAQVELGDGEAPLRLRHRVLPDADPHIPADLENIYGDPTKERLAYMSDYAAEAATRAAADAALQSQVNTKADLVDGTVPLAQLPAGALVDSASEANVAYVAKNGDDATGVIVDETAVSQPVRAFKTATAAYRAAAAFDHTVYFDSADKVRAGLQLAGLYVCATESGVFTSAAGYRWTLAQALPPEAVWLSHFIIVKDPLQDRAAAVYLLSDNSLVRVIISGDGTAAISRSQPFVTAEGNYNTALTLYFNSGGGDLCAIGVNGKYYRVLADLWSAQPDGEWAFDNTDGLTFGVSWLYELTRRKGVNVQVATTSPLSFSPAGGGAPVMIGVGIVVINNSTPHFQFANLTINDLDTAEWEFIDSNYSSGWVQVVAMSDRHAIFDVRGTVYEYNGPGMQYFSRMIKVDLGSFECTDFTGNITGANLEVGVPGTDLLLAGGKLVSTTDFSELPLPLNHGTQIGDRLLTYADTFFRVSGSGGEHWQDNANVILRLGVGEFELDFAALPGVDSAWYARLHLIGAGHAATRLRLKHVAGAVNADDSLTLVVDATCSLDTLTGAVLETVAAAVPSLTRTRWLGVSTSDGTLAALTAEDSVLTLPVVLAENPVVNLRRCRLGVLTGNYSPSGDNLAILNLSGVIERCEIEQLLLSGRASGTAPLTGRDTHIGIFQEAANATSAITALVRTPIRWFDCSFDQVTLGGQVTAGYSRMQFYRCVITGQLTAAYKANSVVRYQFINCLLPAGSMAALSDDGRFAFVDCREL